MFIILIKMQKNGKKEKKRKTYFPRILHKNTPDTDSIPENSKKEEV
jgi:hypothetical protein